MDRRFHLLVEKCGRSIVQSEMLAGLVGFVRRVGENETDSGLIGVVKHLVSVLAANILEHKDVCYTSFTLTYCLMRIIPSHTL